MSPHAHDHGHGHAHGHAHLRTRSGGTDAARAERRLFASLLVSGSYMAVEALGGWWSGSLALLADAGHMLSDVAALGVTLAAVRIGRRPADARRTYGWRRMEVIAAVVNASVLIVIALGILDEAWARASQPIAPQGPLMLAIASGGLLVNLISLALLSADRHHSLNLRGAWLHALSDALGSVGAMVAGTLVWTRGWSLADPIASALIAVLVLRAAWRLLGEGVGVLMENAPEHLDVDALRAALLAVPDVRDVHDLHAWTIASGEESVSAHVVAAEGADPAAVLRAIADVMRERFGIVHSTVQVEPVGFAEDGLHP